ncbi:MAG TPA: hypothetical protein VJ438_06030 [Candidatus Nanoarchaeia archaeon]|nr:hypothetical protein [Candidatus Nanoarchaeia archaeon]
MIEIKKEYEYVSYFLIFGLVSLGLSQINNNIYLGISFISQAVIILGFMEILEKGLKHGQEEK